MEESRCPHCNALLDDGDIFEVYMAKYGDEEKARKYARDHGWTEHNRKQFSRAVIMQAVNTGGQCTICPDCKGVLEE
jgi:hypothetical protein